ncbi:MAG: Gfo/Idh/MocA family oxidoreductase [Phycisphaerales bacterium]|jgi:predicted dehydrogenase|nr:Gfo/Idh/MocA family oxidoreductase [Phycisphaerales bacterium]
MGRTKHVGRTKGIIALMLAGLSSLGTGRRDAEVVPLRIGVVRFVHQHVEGLLWNARERDDITIVGVYEPDDALFERLATKYGVDPSVRFATLEEMLDSAKPEAVSVMSSIADHVRVAEACAPRGVDMLFEKPLAYSRADAERIASLARTHDVLALTNFETSWYASLREAKRLVTSGQMAPIRKMVFRHGHKGPIEIGCTKEFTDWLTDPAQNGGGAIVDFGCYGAVLATWLMDGQRPTSVTASASTLKPEVYPRVDDDATIVLTYPGATAIVQASWAWTHDNKEADVYTERGSIHAGRWDELSVRAPDKEATKVRPPQKPDYLRDEWVYLRHVTRGEREVDPLSSLEFNVIVAEILDEARACVARMQDQPRPE